jgi:hypothetical protein
MDATPFSGPLGIWVTTIWPWDEFQCVGPLSSSPGHVRMLHVSMALSPMHPPTTDLVPGSYPPVTWGAKWPRANPL